MFRAFFTAFLIVALSSPAFAKAPACAAADTFVFVPPNIKAAELENYLKANTPKPEVLKKCGITREEWLASALREHKGKD